jgi:Na+/H+-dicarboxylate symporter
MIGSQVFVVGDHTFDPCRLVVRHTGSLSLLAVEPVELGAHCRTFAAVWPFPVAIIVGFIFSFDRPLDMVRTSVNVTGDLSVAMVVGKWEGELDKSVLEQSQQLRSEGRFWPPPC